MTLRIEYLLMQKPGKDFFIMFCDTRVLECRQEYKYYCVYLCILTLRMISALLFFVVLDLYIKAVFPLCRQVGIPCQDTLRGSFIWHKLYQEYSHLSDLCSNQFVEPLFHISNTFLECMFVGFSLLTHYSDGL